MRLPLSRPRTRLFSALGIAAAAVLVLPALDSILPDRASGILASPACAKDRDRKRDRQRNRKNEDNDSDSGWRRNRDRDDGHSKRDDHQWSRGRKDGGGFADKDDDWSGKRNKGKDNDWGERQDADGRKKRKGRDIDSNDDDVLPGDVAPDEPAPTLDRALAAPAVRKQRRAPQVEDFNPDFDSVDQPVEVLATGMDAAAIDTAKSMGFTPVATIAAPSLGMTATKLRAPSRMGRKLAPNALRTAIPKASFAVNQTYIIYAPSDGTEGGGPDTTPEPGPRAGQCRDDRCYGRAKICWDSEIAARTAKQKIGVIDTAVDLDHPAFAGKTINVGSFLGSARRSEHDWHGTAVLSLLAGRLESGVPGLAPDAEYFMAEAFRTDGDGVATTDTASLIKALDWLETSGVSIVNMSFSGPYDPTFEKAILRMKARGVIFVAAAGNLGPTAGPSYPAAYEDVVAVTAIGKDNDNYSEANRGNFVEFSAPGKKIWTALPGRKEGFRTGTSFAAPYVTAIVAALPAPASQKRLRADRQKTVPAFDLGYPGTDPVFGRGLALAKRSCAGPGVATGPAPEPRPIPAAVTGSITLPPASFGSTIVVPAAPTAAFGP